MLPTPKQGWSGAPVTEALTEGLTCPWAVDTDVNGAALAEYRWGAGKDCSRLCYFTIGTGLGGGLLIDGRSEVRRVGTEFVSTFSSRCSPSHFINTLSFFLLPLFFFLSFFFFFFFF